MTESKHIVFNKSEKQKHFISEPPSVTCIDLSSHHDLVPVVGGDDLEGDEHPAPERVEPDPAFVLRVAPLEPVLATALQCAELFEFNTIII